ncbi:MAG: hypothetical protein ACXQT5_05005 [Candidatus Syntropharchaeia archaeon]
MKFETRCIRLIGGIASPLPLHPAFASLARLLSLDLSLGMGESFFS